MSEEIENVEAEAVEPVAEEQERTMTQREFNAALGKLKYKMQKEYEEKYSGVNVEEYAQLKQDAEAREMELAKERGEIEKVYQAKLAKSQEQIGHLESQLQNKIVNEALLKAATDNDAINPQQVVALLQNRVRFNKDSLSAEVLDESGSTIAIADDGQPLSLDALTKGFLTANQHFQRPTVGGTGSKGSAGGSPQKQESVQDWNQTWENGGKEAYAKWVKSVR